MTTSKVGVEKNGMHITGIKTTISTNTGVLTYFTPLPPLPRKGGGLGWG